MPEYLYKLTPDRTIHLRGFDDLGASAAIHDATANSFKVSGNFRDPADFAVLVIHDADNFFEHPSLKYLPDFTLGGLTLAFDVHYSGLMPLDSPKFPTIDWPYLNVIRADSTTTRIPLFEHAEQVGGSYTPAATSFMIQDNGLKQYDRLTLWYLNYAFDYIVPKVECAYTFTAAGAGTIHSITAGSETYTYVEIAGDSDAAVAQGLVEAAANSTHVTAQRGDGSAEFGSVNQVNLRAKRGDGAAFQVSASSSGFTHELHGIQAETVAAVLAAQINQVNWTALGAIHPLVAQTDGASLTIATTRPGVDGNALRMYSVWKNERLRAHTDVGVFTGGSSDATWRITLDFAALGIPEVRLMWLTFAPALAEGEYEPTEWEAQFTNWHVSGPEPLRRLPLAGPGSARIEEDDRRCTFTGEWLTEAGFYSKALAKRGSRVGDRVEIRYYCSELHDLYLGTSLYVDRGRVGVQVDGDSETTLDCALQTDIAINTRRRLRTALPGGSHSVTLTLLDDAYVYFDFIEAAVPAGIPAPLPPRNKVSPALDYSTDHSYKLPPSRILWSFEQLGFAGPMNEYIGVFWWNQRKRVNAVIPQVTVAFNGDFESGDQVFLSIGGQTIGKSVFPNESGEIIARHFAFFINATLVGVWAQASGNLLKITSRSPKPAYRLPFQAWKEASASSGSVSVNGSLEEGGNGEWVIDPSQSPPLNRGARAWHADLFHQVQARGREIVAAVSMELVNPPAGFAARFPNGQAVETATGFGSLKSTHCAFVPELLGYQKSVYLDLAGLMHQAGLTPDLQFGEFLWWFFSNWSPENPQGGMAFYDPYTMAAAEQTLGRPLHLFREPTDDPSVNGGADSTFLRNRLRDHVAALIAEVQAEYPSARFEVLFPYDVNHPVPAGIHQLGGALNRTVNLPAEWEQKETSGFDRMKMEALDFGVYSRNFDLVLETIRFPLTLGWPRDSVRHLAAIFKSGYEWEREVRWAVGLGLDAVTLWAFDHICLFGWPVRGRRTTGRSARMG